MVAFRKKPVVIDAYQWVPGLSHFPDLALWSDGKLKQDGASLMIETLEGTMRADANDYIIKGVKGEFYPCKPDIFEATYELVE